MRDLFYRLNIQYFNADDGGGTGADGTDVDTPPAEANTKTYSQEDVDSISQKVKESANKEFLESEEYKSFQQWQEAQKTAEEKLQEEKAQLEKDKAEIEKVKMENALIKAGIEATKVKYALLDIAEQNIDITNEEQLKAYIEKSEFTLKQENQDDEDKDYKPLGQYLGKQKSPNPVAKIKGIYSSPED